ncbi:MAG: DUF4349 domain-containing protein [Candidatus Baltobacteraceae bacterium]
MSRRIGITLAAVAMVFALGTAGSMLLPARQAMPENGATGAVEHVMVAQQRKPKFAPPRMANSAGAAPSASAQNVFSSDAQAPQIARTAAISLYVKDVDKGIAAINALARQKHGDVLALDDQRAADANSHARAQMQVRVPDGRFTEALASLGQTGIVRTQSIAAEDLSTQIVDSSARLRNLRRTEGDILKIMDRSGSVGQVLEAENQLTQVREQIETTDAEVKSMLYRVHYSIIDVSLEAEIASVPSAPAGIAQLATAWASAIHALVQFTLGILASLIWILAFTPYVLAVAIIGFVVRRLLLRPV